MERQRRQVELVTAQAPPRCGDGYARRSERRRVQGRRLTGPQQGFGQMWQKTYKVAIPNKTPQQVISTWKAEYGRFWPSNNKFYAPVTGIKPGEIGLIKSTSGPVPLSTGVLVLYSDDVSFSYMTPEGHPFAGFITFSAHVEDPVGTMAQVQLLIRANDPAYEAGMMLVRKQGRGQDVAAHPPLAGRLSRLELAGRHQR